MSRLTTREKVRSIFNELSDNEHSVKLKKFGALWCLLKDAIIVDDYESSEKWKDAIVLSSYGVELCESLSLDVDNSAVYMAMFLSLCGAKLYIDAAASDIDLVVHLIDDDIKQRNIIFPSLSGRELYDRFNECFPGARLSQLSSLETAELLRGAPIGVYQVEEFSVGSLGLVEVKGSRFLPPPKRFPLWHCEDVGCRAIHDVYLNPGASEVRSIQSLIHGASDEIGYLEIERAILRFVDRSPLDQPFSYRDVLLLIGDAFHGEERALLLTNALKGRHTAMLRDFLARSKGKSWLKGDAETISSKLKDDERLQLLSLLTDVELASLIDICIMSRGIDVPATEIRESMIRAPGSRSGSEVSSLGIRYAGASPIVDLCALIFNAYTKNNKLPELQWLLKSQSSSGIRGALLAYLSANEPIQAITNLILSNREVTVFVLSLTGCAFDDRPDAWTAEKILWKLGFSTPRYSDALPTLRRRLDQFSQEIVAVGSIDEEYAREKIRGVGVNLFVSIESFLQELIGYNVWLLTSDHIIDTQFQFDSLRAMESVGEFIGSNLKSGEASFSWSSSGDNTLGCLLSYLYAVDRWINGMVSAERDGVKRHAAQLPHYADNEFRVFPFAHTQLWADADYSALKSFADQFSVMTSKISRSNLASVRNGLDHQRESKAFPSVESMLAFVAHFREALDAAEINLFFPKEHWLNSYSEDRYGRQMSTYVDHADRKFYLTGPSEAIDVPYRRSSSEAILIAPCNLLGLTSAEITFTFKRRSFYSEYWSNYPPKPVDAAKEVARIISSQSGIGDGEAN